MQLLRISLALVPALLPARPLAAQAVEVVPGRVLLKPAAGALSELEPRLAALGLDGALARTLPEPRQSDRAGVGRIRTLTVAPGATLWMQGGGLDAGAPQGVTISNALAYAGI